MSHKTGHVTAIGALLGLSSTLVLTLVPVQPAIAQEDREGGQSLGFTVSEQLSATRNLSLTPGGDDTTFQSVTGLAFSYDDQTRTSGIGFDAAVDLRAANASAAGGTEVAIANPRVSLSYNQSAAAASFGLTGQFSTDDIAYIRPLTDFLDNGVVVLPEDFADLRGTGSRRSLSFDSTLSVRDNAPFGLTFTAGLRDVSYTDVSAPDLIGSTRLNAGVTARFDITDVLQATAGLRYGRLDTGGTISETYTVTAGASLARPDGSYGLRLNATDSGGGTQIGFQLTRDITFRTSAFSAAFGLSRTADDATVMTGSLDYSLTHPAGTLSIGLDRDVVLDAGATDVVTSLSIAGSRELTPDLGASLRIGFARQEADDVTTDLADIGASLSYRLGPDWSLSAGATYELRDDPAGRAAAQTVSLSVVRSFGARN